MTYDEAVDYIHVNWRQFGSPDERQRLTYIAGFLAGIEHAQGDCKCQTDPSSASSPPPTVTPLD